MCNLGVQLLDAGLVWYLWNPLRIDGACILLRIQVLHPIVILTLYTQGMLLPSASAMLAIRNGLGRNGSCRQNS